MKKFWKILGLGVLAAGLTPYKVEKNEETGESSYQALLWKLTLKSGSEDDKKNIDINLNEGTLTSKLMNAINKAEEPHLFSDELCVEYTGGAEAAEKAVETVEKVVEETVEAAEEVAEDTAETVEKTVEEAAEAAAEAVEETVKAVEEAEEAAEEAAGAVEEVVEETVAAVEETVEPEEPAEEEPKAE